MTTLTLSFLGSFPAVVNGRSLIYFRSNQDQALLTYLASQPAPKTMLFCEQLWGERGS